MGGLPYLLLGATATPTDGGYTPQILQYREIQGHRVYTVKLLRTTFVVYVCIERSERGAKGTPRIL